MRHTRSVFIAHSVRQCSAFCVYSFGNNNIDNCLRDGGYERGRGTHFEHVPTNELYCAPGDVYDSFKLLCVCVRARVHVCVPTYWQLRDLNSLSFFLIFMCYSAVLLSSGLLSPLLSSSVSLYPLLLSFFSLRRRFYSIMAQTPSSMPLFRV